MTWVMQKNVVYTAIYGNYDNLIEVEDLTTNCDFVCFTDNPNLESKTYKIIYLPVPIEDKWRAAKLLKLFPHLFLPDYEYSLWIDASVSIKKIDFSELINKYLQQVNLAVYRHPDRKSVVDELEACTRYNKDSHQLMRNQVESYISKGFKDDQGLVAATVILRKHHETDVRRFSKKWWNEILTYSKRDQLSFNYVAWKTKLQYRFFDGSLYENDHFNVSHEHNLVGGVHLFTKSIYSKLRIICFFSYVNARYYYLRFNSIIYRSTILAATVVLLLLMF
jgi:hypothetical protein